MGVKDVIQEFGDFEAHVSRELRAQRRRANISIKEMAELVGLHPNTLGKCERGEFGISLDIVYGYAKVLNRPLSVFVGSLEWQDSGEGNPIAELSEEEMFAYSQLLQGIFNLFASQDIKLTPARSVDATKLVARAIIEQRPD